MTTSERGARRDGDDARLLSVSSLSVVLKRGADPVLQGVDLAIDAGETVALIGPSGAGKTTLLRALGGQIRPSAGVIRVHGAAISALTGRRLREVRRDIGFVAQKHDLVEPLAVHRNVMAGALGRWSDLRALRYLVWATAAELADARRALDAVGLAGKLREPTSALSGGEQQRVAIARALVQSPRLLLADEPVAALDPTTAVEVLDLLTRLCRDHGMTLVCSLHQPDLAHRFFGRILEMRDGRLIRDAAADERGSPCDPVRR